VKDTEEKLKEKMGRSPNLKTLFVYEELETGFRVEV
jgi:hypothetical protein